MSKFSWFSKAATKRWASFAIVGGFVIAVLSVVYAASASDVPLPARLLQALRDHGAPEEKLAAIRQEVELYREGAGRPAEEAPPPPEPDDPLARIQPGIYEAHAPDSPFMRMGLEFTNAWIGIVDGAMVQVFAGYRTQDPKQGVVAVYIQNHYGMEIKVYHLPRRDVGVPRIESISSDNNNVFLITTKGKRFVFSIHKRTITEMEE